MNYGEEISGYHWTGCRLCREPQGCSYHKMGAKLGIWVISKIFLTLLSHVLKLVISIKIHWFIKLDLNVFDAFQMTYVINLEAFTGKNIYNIMYTQYIVWIPLLQSYSHSFYIYEKILTLWFFKTSSESSHLQSCIYDDWFFINTIICIYHFIHLFCIKSNKIFIYDYISD